MNLKEIFPLKKSFTALQGLVRHVFTQFSALIAFGQTAFRREASHLVLQCLFKEINFLGSCLLNVSNNPIPTYTNPWKASRSIGK